MCLQQPGHALRAAISHMQAMTIRQPVGMSPDHQCLGWPPGIVTLSGSSSPALLKPGSSSTCTPMTTNHKAELGTAVLVLHTVHGMCSMIELLCIQRSIVSGMSGPFNHLTSLERRHPHLQQCQYGLCHAVTRRVHDVASNSLIASHASKRCSCSQQTSTGWLSSSSKAHNVHSSMWQCHKQSCNARGSRSNWYMPT